MFLIANCEQNSTLAHYTQYKPSELRDCVKALHRLLSVGLASNLPAIREKYSQHKVTGFDSMFHRLAVLLPMLMPSILFPQYKFVAKKHCPPSIPTEFFQDASC